MVQNKEWAAVIPGIMGACSIAIDLFGLNRIDPGSWMTPVWVFTKGLGEEDLVAAADLLRDKGLILLLEAR